MTDKELLIRDLCCKLPYGVVIQNTEEDNPKVNFICYLNGETIGQLKSGTNYFTVKPCLRQMDDMTEAEKIYFNGGFPFLTPTDKTDWLDAHLIDHRGLIPRGLAVRAKEYDYNLREVEIRLTEDFIKR